MKSWILGKFGLLVLLISATCLYLVAFHFDFRIRPMSLLRISVTSNGLLTPKTKTILFWNTLFGDENFYFGEGEIFRNCPVNDCIATHDRDFQNIEDFDALLFHANELRLDDLPLKRKPKQFYVFVNLESPANRPLQDNLYEDYFNLTMTYRLDSDVIWTYGHVRDIKTGEVVAPRQNTTWIDYTNDTDTSNLYDRTPSELTKLLETKSKAIIWFVSNCHAKSGRLEYVKELKKYINVDIYGKCGDGHECRRNQDCFHEVAEPGYFFYLSFENSLCVDYVTEKLYQPLSYYIVPIVYGGANYSIFVPPGSYVDALNFDSPKELAAYLRNLLENPREYVKYFRWKERYRVESSTGFTACKLCEFLHERKEEKYYSPLSSWYSWNKCPLQSLLDTQKYVTRTTLKSRT